MLRVECLEGNQAGEKIELDGRAVVLGRGLDCDLVVSDDACSRRHARLEPTSGGYRIVDLGSTNGVVVNGRRTREARLAPGDRFTIGRTLFAILPEAEELEERDTEVLGGGPDLEILIEDTIRADDDIDIESTLPPRGKGLDRERAPEEAARMSRLVRMVYQVSRTISTTLMGEDLHRLIADSVLEHFESAERVVVFLRREGRRELEEVMNVSRHATDLPVSRSVLRRVESDRVGVLASDAAKDDRFESSLSVKLSGAHSLMCVPLLTRNSFLGAIYVDSRQEGGCFRRPDLELLTVLANQMAFAVENAILYADIQRSFYETVRSLGNALEAKDPYTRGHSQRVGRIAVGIGRELGLDAESLDRLRTAAELHDIGKIAITESIIGKAGRLTQEEFEAMKKHPELGVETLKPIRFLAPILPSVLYHHERYDGTGYPEGRRGEEIPLAARILGLADAFDAMTTRRPYNLPVPAEVALEHCAREAGACFDPRCVEALRSHVESLAGAGLRALSGEPTGDTTHVGVE